MSSIKTNTKTEKVVSLERQISEAHKWYQDIDSNLKANLYDHEELVDLWTKIYNKAVDLQNADSDLGFKFSLDSLDEILDEDQGHFDDGADLTDFTTEQANESHDFASKQMWNQAAASVTNPDALYVQDASDPSDVELADDDDVELVVSDIIAALE